MKTKAETKQKVISFYGWLKSKGMKCEHSEIRPNNIGVSMVIAVAPSTELKEMDELVKWGEDLGWSLNDYEVRGDDEWYIEWVTK